MKINITYATILGTSQMLAEDLEDALSGAHEVVITDIMHVSIDDLYDGSLYVFISSTTGRGEIPESATDFVADLNDIKPDLSALNFAIFGLGDMGYAETFNMGSQRLADLLKGCGATQIGERGLTTPQLVTSQRILQFHGLRASSLSIPHSRRRGKVPGA